MLILFVMFFVFCFYPFTFTIIAIVLLFCAGREITTTKHKEINQRNKRDQEKQKTKHQKKDKKETHLSPTVTSVGQGGGEEGENEPKQTFPAVIFCYYRRCLVLLPSREEGVGAA